MYSNVSNTDSKSEDSNLVHLTCAICRIQLKDNEAKREHHRTEWHCYNLKRKIANLSPLTPEEYITKIDQLKSTEREGLDKSKKAGYRCHDCKKAFSNKSTYDDHLQSKKHKNNVKNFESEQNGQQEKFVSSPDEEDMEVEEVDSDEWDDDTENPIDINQCLFCLEENGNLYKNLEHMTSFHSFFIPDIEFCTDITGLLKYLGEKVTKYYMCLWCNEKGRTFYTVDAAKSHMVDKGHCRMIFEGVALTEYVDFYDYSSSYPDAEECFSKDDEISMNVLDDSDFQLVLPSGVTIGHRSLLRYYKQNASRSSTLVPSKNTKKLHKVLATYRALGWSQTEQEKAARKARDIHYLKRAQSKWFTKMGVKNNKFQKHYRQQVNY